MKLLRSLSNSSAPELCNFLPFIGIACGFLPVFSLPALPTPCHNTDKHPSFLCSQNHSLAKGIRALSLVPMFPNIPRDKPSPLPPRGYFPRHPETNSKGHRVLTSSGQGKGWSGRLGPLQNQHFCRSQEANIAHRHPKHTSKHLCKGALNPEFLVDVP